MDESSDQAEKKNKFDQYLITLNQLFFCIWYLELCELYDLFYFFLEQLIDLTIQQLTVLRKIFIYIARSFVPDSRRQIDKAIEGTII